MNKIAVDARVLQTRPYTGVALYVHHLLGEWAKRGQDKSFHLYFNTRKNFFLPPDLNGYEKTQYYLSNKILNFAWTIQARPRLEKYVKESLLWVPNLNYLPAVTQKMMVLSVHDLSWLHFPEFFSYRRRWWHALIKFELLTKRATRIAAVSDFTKQDLIESLALPEKNIVAIHLGVDSDFYLQKEEVLLEPSLPEKFIAYVGAIEPRKNIRTIIAAFNILASRDQDLHLVLAGPLGWLHKPVFVDIKKSPHHKRIIYYGYLKRESKRYILQRAQVFAFPSFYEGFGLPPLEAMAAGCPVVAANVASLPEVLGQAALLVNPHQTNELAEAIWQVLTSARLREQMKADGLKWVKNFTWQKAAEKTYALFSSLDY